MIHDREMNFDDYARVLRRRLRLIVLPAVIGAIAGYLLTLFLTAKYTSTTLMLIERPTVPQDVVQSPTTDDLFTLLATMSEQIESRTRLQPLIERYDLYKRTRAKSMEEAVDQMRKDIDVKQVKYDTDIIKGSKQPPLPGFTISFTADNPRQAQQVNTELTSMFMTEDLQQHENTARGTTDFLAKQLTDAKRALDDQDAKLAEYKSKNLGALPEDQQSNLQVLAALNTQIAAVTEELSRAEQDKAFTQSLVAQQEAAWQSSSRDGTQAVSADTLQDQLTKMKENLTFLQGRYTDSYPDVVKLKGNIAQIEKQIADQKTAGDQGAPATQDSASPKPNGIDTTAKNAAGQNSAASAHGSHPKSGPADPASIQELRARLKQTDIFVKAKTQEQAKLQRQANLIESRLQVSPAVEEQFKQLSMGHETALKFYNTLLASRDQSQMSVDLESRGQGEHFGVLDSANLPQQPSFPVWWQFVLGGLAVGLGLGLAAAAFLEMRDKSIRDERDVEFYLELPILALVPHVGADHSKGKLNFLKRKPKHPELQAVGAAK